VTNIKRFSYSHVLVVVAAVVLLVVLTAVLVAVQWAVAVITMCSLSLQLVGNFIPVNTC